MLAQAGMSLAVIIAQSPAGADQMNEDGGGDGLVYSVIALVGLALGQLIRYYKNKKKR